MSGLVWQTKQARAEQEDRHEILPSKPEGKPVAFLIKTFFVPGAAGGQKSFETVTGVKFDTFGFATGI